MTYTQQLPPPTDYKAYSSVSVGSGLAVASVRRPGIGFTVEPSPVSPGWVRLVAVDAVADGTAILQVHVDGLPALIASLQDCLPTETDR